MSNVIVQPFVEVCGRFQLAGVLAELQMCPAGSCTTESYLFPVVSISQYSLGQGKALNSVLYEAYLNCGGNWTSSKLYLPITSTNSTRKAGKRKWMTRRELEERFGKDARWEGLEKHVGVGRLFFALSHLRTVPLTNSFGSVIPWQLAIDCTKCYKHRPVVDTCANDALSMEIWKISPMMLQVPSLKLTATAPETLGHWFRWVSFWVSAPGQVQTVSFRECIYWNPTLCWDLLMETSHTKSLFFECWSFHQQLFLESCDGTSSWQSDQLASNFHIVNEIIHGSKPYKSSPHVVSIA